MASPDYSINRPGQQENTGSAYALFLKVFSGEVLTAFGQDNSMEGCQMTKTITAGKSAQFPIMGRTTADFHSPGTLLLGNAIPQNERVISVDNMTVADVTIAEIDEMMNHYDVRSPYSQELGQALRNRKNLLQTITLIQAARTNRTLSTGVASAGLAGITPPDSVIDANCFTTESALRSALFKAAERLDKQFVPPSDRFVQLAPAQYYLLVNAGVGAVGFLNQDIGGGGSISAGTLPLVAGFRPIKNYSYPTWKARDTVNGLAQPALANNTYGPAALASATSLYGYNKSCAIAHHKSATGTVQMRGISVETEYSVARQASIAVAKYVAGHGVLRPEAAVEICSAESDLT